MRGVEAEAGEAGSSAGLEAGKREAARRRARKTSRKDGEKEPPGRRRRPEDSQRKRGTRWDGWRKTSSAGGSIVRLSVEANDAKTGVHCPQHG